MSGEAWAGILIGAALTVVSTVISIWFALRPTHRRRLAWTMTTTTLVRGEGHVGDGLMVHYRGTPVATLSVSKIAIWNDGKAAIRREDLSRTDPPRFEVRGNLMEARIVQDNHTASAFELKDLSHNAVGIEFAYLRPNDGVVLELVHTGTSSSDVDLVGEVIDADRHVWAGYYTALPLIPKDLRRRAPWIRVAIVESLFLVPSLGWIALNTLIFHLSPWIKLFIFGWAPALFLLLLWYNFGRPRMPKTLRPSQIP